jgi:Flp pilus assembly pilin Flp
VRLGELAVMKAIAPRRRAVLNTAFYRSLLVELDSGQEVVEYGLLIAVIALVVLIGIFTFGNLVQPWFGSLTAHVTTTGT